MKSFVVEDKFDIVGRGELFTVKLDGQDLPSKGEEIELVDKGVPRIGRVRAVEHYMLLIHPPRPGNHIGIMLHENNT